ncbi:hypothetical protein GCM10010121_091110 [Streptomyces brasiliensis]|uniref:Transposase n=1 Tax=Streptomyces brasiliensis TaxID=1954 RepID=A0A917ULA8_9ACTN|nr:hypothetical protein GCM10010121_091110 [Streptomyces brasiliensis]
MAPGAPYVLRLYVGFDRELSAEVPVPFGVDVVYRAEHIVVADKPHFPAEHWIPLRTPNPIESTFAIVRLRTTVTRGAGSRTAALAMVFKLVESARGRWRAVNAPHLVALVHAGTRFECGQLIERLHPLTACTTSTDPQ